MCLPGHRGRAGHLLDEMPPRPLVLGAGQPERWSVPRARGGGPAAERLSALPVAPLHDIMSFLKIVGLRAVVGSGAARRPPHRPG